MKCHPSFLVRFADRGKACTQRRVPCGSGRKYKRCCLAREQEQERSAGERRLPADPAGLAATCRAAALELVRFVPPSRSIEPSFFTTEGDPIVLARAVWRVADPEAAFAALDSPPELLSMEESEEESGEVFQLTGDRSEACAYRPPLPPGAI